MGIALYGASEWRRSGSSFAIEQPECFREYVVPVLRTHLHSAVSPHILKAIAYIKENYAENIRISDIAAALYIHPNYLSSIFTKQMGISLVAYITNYRLLVAQKMLMETDLSVEKIALEGRVLRCAAFFAGLQKPRRPDAADVPCGEPSLTRALRPAGRKSPVNRL